MLRHLGLACVLLAAVIACGCGGGGGDGGGVVTREYMGTQSPGDLWTWSVLTSGTWSAANTTLGFTYSGTWVTLPSGFLHLTITATTDPGTTPGDKALALEVPDTVLVVKPGGSGSNLIVAARIGACPAGPTLDLNWVEVTDSGFNQATDTAYGTTDLTIAGAAWTAMNQPYLLDGTALTPETISTLSCADGVITNSAAPAEVIAIAPTGVFISDNGPGMGGVIGMNAPATSIVLSDVTAAGREYRAFQYKDGSTGLPDSRPNWARPNGAGGLTGGDYLDVVTNTEDTTNTATIQFLTQPSPGVVNGTLTDGAGTSNIVFMINRIAGRYFIFGIAVDTNDGRPYNFIALEQ